MRRLEGVPLPLDRPRSHAQNTVRQILASSGMFTRVGAKDRKAASQWVLEPTQLSRTTAMMQRHVAPRACPSHRLGPLHRVRTLSRHSPLPKSLRARCTARFSDASLEEGSGRDTQSDACDSLSPPLSEEAFLRDDAPLDAHLASALARELEIAIRAELDMELLDFSLDSHVLSFDSALAC